MSPIAPHAAGSLLAAASLTFGLAAPPDLFRLLERPQPELGPGLDRLTTLATECDLLLRQTL